MKYTSLYFRAIFLHLTDLSGKPTARSTLIIIDLKYILTSRKTSDPLSFTFQKDFFETPMASKDRSPKQPTEYYTDTLITNESLLCSCYFLSH